MSRGIKLKGRCKLADSRRLKSEDVANALGLGILILGTFLWGPRRVFAAFEDFSFGAKPGGMADAYTAVASDIHSIRYNPAGLSFLAHSEVAVDYRLFWGGIEGLHNITVGSAIPYKKSSGFGLSLQEIGFSLQREHSIEFSASHRLTKELSFGLGLVGYHIYNSRFGDGFTYGFDMGFIGVAAKRWLLGVSLHNLNRPQISTASEGEIGSVIRAGLGYRPFPGIYSDLDFCYEYGISGSLSRPLKIAMGSEFEILPPLVLRVGVKNEPLKLCGGLGVRFKFLRFDYSSVFQPELPLHHNFGLSALF